MSVESMDASAPRGYRDKPGNTPAAPLARGAPLRAGNAGHGGQASLSFY